MSILDNKCYSEESVFKPENLLREAKRQKGKPECDIPSICLLDPDGDLLDYLLKSNLASKNECWACYHSTLYHFTIGGHTIGIIPCVVGASYAVLVAEQLFVSGCKLLISITSAGIINNQSEKRFALITSSVRDEGTSYHYLPPEKNATINEKLFRLLSGAAINTDVPFFNGTSWTTDAPYRETSSAIAEMKKQNITCVEMEAAALYALAEVKNYNIICFAYLTNSMAQTEGDFEKGEEFGSVDTLNLISHLLKRLSAANIF
jgi:purine-nucleoside phosphorylase